MFVGDDMNKSEAEIFVSNYNKTVLERLNPPSRVTIFDTTLRDGEQQPNIALSVDSKLEIATALSDLGVDIIEAGFPANSEGEKEAVKKVASAGLNAKICALCRCTQGDIDAALDCDVDDIHVFIATSDIHLKHKLKTTREQAQEKAIWAVDYVKAHGRRCEFSCEDATRTDLDFLKKMHLAVQEAHVDRIDVPDTVGTMSPAAMSYLIGELKKVTKVPLAVHCHNDFGLAVANSLAAVGAGAEQVHVTINGLGERAGNAALEEVVMGLISFFGLKTNVNTKKITSVSRLVSRLTGVYVQPNKAIVGENAFAHESGIHVHGILGAAETYEPMMPDLVGKERKIVVGKHTGTHSISNRLEAYGLQLSQEQTKYVTETVKRLAESGKRVDDAELVSLAYDVLGRPSEKENLIKIEEFTAVTGLNFTPTATVSLLVEGEKRRRSDTGVGPIDAALKAIRNAVSQDISLQEYRLEAITGGSDALCEVTVKLADNSPMRVYGVGRAVGPDIVTTSVDATVEGLNRLLWTKKTRQQTTEQK